MSYLVLARKARPQTFDQVVGQRPVVKTLLNSIRRDRIAHAILFSGVRGVGKTTMARIMAKAINCRAEDVNSRPCGVCISCREISSGASLDLYEIDGASNRGIQEIRELKEKIRFLPTSSRAKIIIIDEVHMLTTEAFNALLKTLEEPPAHVYFMFATTEKHKIPITILSRCQQYELQRVSAKELFDHFKKLTESEGFEIDPSALSLIVREAGGSVRDGLSLLDQMFSFGEKKIEITDVVDVLGLVNRDVLMQITEGLLSGNRSAVFLALEEIFAHGMDVRRFMEDLMFHFRTLLLSKINGCGPLIDLPEEDVAAFRGIAARYPAETLHLQLTMLMNAAETLRFSDQPRLALETSFLKIMEAGNVVPISTLLGHIDELMKGLPAPLCELYPEAGPAKTTPPPSLQPFLEKKTEKLPQPQHSEPVAKPRSEISGAELEKAPGPEIAVTKPVPAAAPPVSHDAPQPEPQASTASPRTPVMHPHERDIRKDWLEFIGYVKERKVWMAQDLQRADSMKTENNELRLTFKDPANCALLRQKDNLEDLATFAADFFQKTIKIIFVVPSAEELADTQGTDSVYKKRQQLANDPLVVMATEIFTGEVGDIRIGPKWR